MKSRRLMQIPSNRRQQLTTCLMQNVAVMQHSKNRPRDFRYGSKQTSAHVRLVEHLRVSGLCQKRTFGSISIRHAVAKVAKAYRDLPPAFLHSDLNFLRCSPCKPLALAWSLQDFAIVFF